MVKEDNYMKRLHCLILDLLNESLGRKSYLNTGRKVRRFIYLFIVKIIQNGKL